MEHEQYEIMSLLIEAGANINLENREGQTALHQAVINNNIKAVEILLKAGAKLNTVDNSQETPLESAKKNNNIEILELLTIKEGK